MQYDPPNLSEPYERILTEKGMAKGNWKLNCAAMEEFIRCLTLHLSVKYRRKKGSFLDSIKEDFNQAN